VSEPFIFVGTHKINEGKLDEFKRDCRKLVELVQEHEPQLISFNFYLSEDETEVSVVQVHPDADSMLLHMQVAREHITEATEEQLITNQIQVFGSPNDAVSGMMEQLTQSGVPVNVKPNHIAGFTRRA